MADDDVEDRSKSVLNRRVLEDHLTLADAIDAAPRHPNPRLELGLRPGGSENVDRSRERDLHPFRAFERFPMAQPERLEPNVCQRVMVRGGLGIECHHVRHGE